MGNPPSDSFQSDASPSRSLPARLEGARARLIGVVLSLVPFGTLIVNVGLAPERDPLLIYAHYLGCLFMLLHSFWAGVQEPPRPDEASRAPRFWIGGILCLAYLGLARFEPSPNCFFFMFLLGLAAIDGAGGERSRSGVFRATLTGSLIYGAAALLDNAFLWSGQASDGLVWLLSTFNYAFRAELELLSFTQMGGWFLLCAVPAVVSLLRTLRGRQRWLGAAAVLSLSIGVFWHVGSPDLQRLVLFGLIGLAIPATAQTVRPADPILPPRLRWTWLAASTLLAAGLAVSYWDPAPARREGRVVVLPGDYAREIPDADIPKKPDGASLGFFFRFLERSGLPCSFPTAPLDEAMLRGARAVMICNLTRTLTPQERSVLDAYIRGGGTLWLFGDHTDLFGQMPWVNDILAPDGMELLFDSAMPYGPSIWRGSFVSTNGGWSRIGIPLDHLRVSVGASIRVKGVGRALVVARQGYSDDGDRAAPQRGFLGNWRYDSGRERLGDLCLIGAARRGEGRVLFAGDTAILQESSFSESWPFVSSLLNGGAERSSADLLRLSAGAVLVLASLLILGRLALPSGPILLALLLPWVGFLVADGVTTASWRRQLPSPSGVAWFDLQEGSDVELHGRSPMSPDSFFSALAAAGYVPLFHYPGVTRPSPGEDLLILPPGRTSLTKSRTQEILKFCAEGGTVLVVAGHGDARAYQPLLEPLGISLLPQPLGTCPEAKASGNLPVPNFLQSWALSISPTTPAWTPWVTGWDRPVVASRKIERGTLVVVADSDFMGDKNFAVGRTFKPKNFQFLNRLLRAAKETP